jgi:benzoate/toluate 1,2-dioxygenase reductase subunit
MEPMTSGRQIYSTQLLDRRFLSDEAFEINLSRPPGFSFHPGQRVALILDRVTREYSIASPPEQRGLTLCIRLVDQGKLSPQLAHLNLKSELALEGPLGHFLYQPTDRRSIFVAGGTGVAPYRAMVAHGLRPTIFIQGAPNIKEAYYYSWFRRRLDNYVLCLSQDHSFPGEGTEAYPGRVTDYLTHHLVKGPYDFYVCGGPQLVRDVVALIDDDFPQSRVHTELFS